MNLDTTGVDILDQYRNISNKLKKRFLRKPNEIGACESYMSLGRQCESTELPTYAGLCWIAAAKCENSLSNTPSETSCLMRSARQFLKAEENDLKLGCVSPSENLQAAIYSYNLVSTKFHEDCPFSTGMYLEIVNFLKKIDREEYIEEFLNKAVQLSENDTDTHIHCLDLLATNFINSGDFVGALELFTKISDILEDLTITGARSEVLHCCEINRILLLLILRPAPQKLSPASAKLLEKYTWGDKHNSTFKAGKMTEQMVLLLESLVTICQSLDTRSLIDLESELWPLLTVIQRDLLRILVKVYYP